MVTCVYCKARIIGAGYKPETGGLFCAESCYLNAAARVTNHWSIWVCAAQPVTGVINNNEAAQFIADEMYYHGGINLAYEAALAAALKYKRDKERAAEEFNDSWEDSSDDTWLIGSWKKIKGQYEPDKSGEYAAIVRESTTQIVYSKTIRRGRLCSPCYPGQVEYSGEGDYLGYDLPEEAYKEY